MSESTKQHRCESPKSVRCAVVTISDTRTLETDRGGELIVKLLTEAGNEISVRGGSCVMTPARSNRWF